MRPDLVFVLPPPDARGNLRPTRVATVPLLPAARGTILVVTWVAGQLGIDSYTTTTKGHAR